MSYREGWKTRGKTAYLVPEERFLLQQPPLVPVPGDRHGPIMTHKQIDLAPGASTQLTPHQPTHIQEAQEERNSPV
jgi:hypothetical protein